MWTPGHTWSVLHPGWPPLLAWFPLVPSDWAIWASPPETTRTPVQGGYPRYHSILSSPQEGVPLSLDLSASLPPEFCPLPIVCFVCGTWHRAFMQKHCQLEEFINSCVNDSFLASGKQVFVCNRFSQCEILHCVGRGRLWRGSLGATIIMLSPRLL